MKGLLLKELYTFSKSRIIFWATPLVICLISKFEIGSLSAVLVFTTISITIGFFDDDSSRWNDYSRALPYTSTQIVSSKYLFLLTETVLSTAIAVTIIIYSYKSSDDIMPSLSKYFPHMSENWRLASFIPLFALARILGTAFAIPINYKLKGNLKSFITLIPLMISFAYCYVIILKTDVDVYLSNQFSFSEIFYNEKWVFAACAAAIILAVAVSWIVCIIFADNSKKRTKKLIKPAAILGGLLIALTAFSFTALNVKGYFEEKEKHENYQDDFSVNYETPRKLDLKKREITKDQKNARAEMQELMDSFIFENHLGDNHQNLIDKILGMGYHDTGYNSEEFKSVKDENIYDNVTIRLYLEGETDLISVVDTTVSPGQFWIESATDDELDDLAKQFPIGMSQAELHEKLKTLQVVPTQVSERYFDNERFLYYTLYYEIGDYNNSGSAYYRIHIDVADGVIFDTRNYVQR